MNAARRNRGRRNGLVSFLVATILLPLRLLQALYHATLGRFFYALRVRGQQGAGRLGRFGVLGDILLMPFVMFFAGLWYFLVEWTSSRQGRGLLFGLPSVVFGVFVLTVLAFGSFFSSEDSRIARYENEARKALEDERYHEARLYFEKLSRLREGDDRYRYYVALTYELEGDKPRAHLMMVAMAPLDQPGYARAHYWLAKQLLEDENVTIQGRAIARQHLRNAIKADENDKEARYAYARMLVTDGEYEKAVVEFKVLAEDNPLIRIQVADLLREVSKQRGLVEYEREASIYIRSAREEFEKLTNKEPTEFQHWFWLHQCYLFERDFDEALITLERALRETGNEGAKVAAARVHMLWSEDLLRRGNVQERLGEILLHLESSLTLAPNYPPALALLVRITELPELATDEAVRLLNDHLVEAEAPALIHFMLGTKYAASNEFDKAMFHFELAHQENRQMSPVLNNMAWVLMQQGSADPEDERLDRAMTLIEQAIQIDPQHLTYYDTRGLIHMRMGNHRDAVVDFERAQAELGGKNVRFHESLAECYEAIDRPELADAHRRKAEEIRRRLGQ